MKVHDAAAFFGSKALLARALGITPGAVTQWGDDVPRSREFEIRYRIKEAKRKSRRRNKDAA